MLDEADILNLIRLNELDLRKTYQELESLNEELRNNAGEVVFQTEELAKKLKKIYEELNPNYSIYPKYEEYLRLIK
jgi:hypothetical protein